MVIFRPTGEISVHEQKMPIRPVTDVERKAAVERGLWQIVCNAARLGDAGAFKRADLQWRQQSVEAGSTQIRDFLELRMLAKAGQSDVAIEFARAVPNLSNRVSALLRVAEGIAGISYPSDGPFFP
jgi:hypothetical protein